jgi:hypothetical protein
MQRGCRYGAALFLVATALPALVLYAQQPPGERPLEATVVSVTGTVEAKLTEEAAWQPAQVGMKLPQGASICTGVRSKVELDFDSHSVVIIRRPSIVRVDRFLLSERAVETRLHLRVGSLRAGVVKERIASDFRVTTPAVTVSARGTEIADVTHSDRGTEVRMGQEGRLDMTTVLGVTRSIPPSGYSRSWDLVQVVDAKKMEQSYRSYRHGRSEGENLSARREPSNQEDARAESLREAAHPELQRILRQSQPELVDPESWVVDPLPP